MTRKFLGWMVMILILASASVLYFSKIGEIPSGFYIDEASTAYNAISIFKTGKDEFGKTYPILFRLFGSYTPPLYIYLSAFLLRFFKPTIVFFRSISAFSAITSTLFFCLMVKKLRIYKREPVYYFVTFFYAISPWLVFNARLGYEVTLGYIVFNIGLYFSYLALENKKYFLFAFPILSLSVYASHNQKFLAPIFILFYFLVFKKTVFRKERVRCLILSLLFAVLIQIPNLSIITTNAFWIKNIGYTGGTPVKKMLQNIIVQLLNYYSPKSLFYFLPDIDPQHTVSEISVLYNWMFIPYLIGTFLLFNKIKERKYRFVALLFLASVIPAALSGEFISIQRALPFLLPLMIVIGMGIDFIISRIKKAYAVNILFLFFSSYSLLMLYRSYFVLFPKDRAVAWSYGFSDLARFIAENPKEKFFIDNSRNLGLYMELLYFLQYPPSEYQKEVTPYIREHYYEAPILGTDFSFANIRIGGIDWTKEIYKEQIIIGDSLAVSDGQAKEHVMKEVYQLEDPLGKIVFKGYRTNPKEKCRKEKLLGNSLSRWCLSN